MKYFIKPTTQSGRTMNLAQRYLLPLCVAAFALAGCGGGASNSAVVSTGNGGTGSGAVGGATSTQPTITLSLTSLAGAPLTNNAVPAGTSFQANAVLKSSTGVGLVNQLVKFSAANGSTLVTMSPPSGEALTDSTGKASVVLTAIAPSAGGPVGLIATSSVGSVALTSAGNTSGNVTIGSANVSLGSVSYIPSQPNATTLLPTNSTVALQIPVSSNGLPVNNASLNNFTVTSPCQSMVPPQAEITPVGIVSGVLTVNYKNKGCAASPDVVAISMTGVNTPATATLYPATSTPAELKFVSLMPSGTSLVVKGSAGLGRQESGNVRFRLVDNAGSGVGNNTLVSFRLTTLAGGLSLGATTPISSVFTGYTNNDGYVDAPLFSGTVPTPVSVLASTNYLGTTLTAASSGLNVSVGVAEQRNFSFGPEKLSINAWAVDGVTTDFTAFLADLWGNSVADGTIVNMITEGGQIGSATGGACSTVNGACKLTFRSQNFRPRNGRISLVAYTPGIDSFNDANGNGVYDPGEEIFNNGDPYIDYNENGVRSTGLSYTAGAQNNLYPSSAEFYVSSTGAYNPPKPPTTSQSQRNSTTIFKQSTIVLSGDPAMLVQTKNDFSYLNAFGAAAPSYHVATPPLVLTPDLSTGANYAGVFTNAFTLDAWDNPNNNYGVDFRNNCSPQYFMFKVTDLNNNPVAADSTVAVDSPTSLTASAVSPDKTGGNAWGGTAHHVLLTPDQAKCGTSHPYIPAVPADPLATPPIVAAPAIPATVVTGYFGIKVSTPTVNVTFTIRARY